MSHQYFAAAPPRELTATAIQARAKAAFQAWAIPAPRTFMWQWAVTRGLVQAFDDPDYPLVLAHDYGCEVTA